MSFFMLFPDTRSSSHLSVCHLHRLLNGKGDLSPARAELLEVEHLRWCPSNGTVDVPSDQPLCHGRRRWSSAWGEGDTDLFHLEHAMNLDAERSWIWMNLGCRHKDFWKGCSSQVCNSVVPVMRRENTYKDPALPQFRKTEHQQQSLN